MSDADAEETGREIWIEKYRPQTLDDIHGQEETIERVKSYVEGGELPHMLFTGPAGVGKCVTGDTPVLTSRGVERISNAVGDVDGLQEPESDFRVPTFGKDGSFEYVNPSYVFGKEANELVEVETRDGAGMAVTPEHKLLVLGSAGLEWKRAEDVSEGDRLARPHSVPTPEDPAIDPLASLDPERIRVAVNDSFAAEHGTESELWLGDFHELDLSRSERREGVASIQYVNSQGNESTPITPIWEQTPRLGEFLGLAISEARIDNGRIKFYNTDEALLDTFEQAVEDLFGIETTRGEQKGVPYVRVISQTLVHLLETTFDSFACANGSSPDSVGSAIISADEETRCAFLRAMFDAEGHITETGIIELSQRRESHITLLSYLLTSIGIPSRRKAEMKAATNGSGVEREYHTLYISGATALQQFRDRVGFSVERKQERLAANAAKDPNPNHDTVPTQTAARELCEQLNLSTTELLTKSLDSETPSREAYLEDIDAVVDAAAERVETAQEVLRRIDSLRAELDSVTRLPAVWAGSRQELAPIETRRELSESTAIRSDRLLEYSDGRRTPTAERASDLLAELDATETAPETDAVRSTLENCIDALGVSYNKIAEGTAFRGPGLGALLENDDHDLGSLTRFETVAEEVRSAAVEMLSTEVIQRLSTLDRVAEAELYYDEVTTVETIEETRTVYDLTVPGTRNYVAGDVPTVMHNTTTATAIAREIYGDDWRGNFLELNASDERGIDVVRDRIKNFARSAFGGEDYRIIFLDEADSLTSDAQSALRRTMEQFSDNTRFILSCNYSSKIIDPIQSRCAVFRYSPLSEEAIAGQIREIAEAEDIELTEEGLDALVYAANGDMRRAINNLQAAATTGDVVDEEAVYTVTATARPEEVEEMVAAAVAGDFPKARATLDTLLTDVGMAGGDIVDQLHRSAWEFDLDDRAVVRLLERLGEADYRIAEGANEQVQLEALLASLSLDGE